MSINPIQSHLYCKNTADRMQLSNNIGTEQLEKEKKASYEKAGMEISR